MPGGPRPASVAAVRNRPGTQAPRIDPPRLGSLDTGTAEDLRPRADLEGARYADLDVEELLLADATAHECAVTGAVAQRADLQRTRLRDCTVERLDVPVLRAARTDWRDVHVSASRLGSVEAHGSTWGAVRLTGCRLGFVNLRGATLQDVELVDCTVEELDLAGATLTRVRFPGTRLGQLDVQHAELAHVDLRGAELEAVAGTADLRGATVDSGQLALLAPLLAADLGLVVED